MGQFKEVDGDIITLGQEAKFDVIAHGCNCFCTMGAGLAPQMADAFGCDEFPLEDRAYEGDPDKLGRIDYKWVNPVTKEHSDIREEDFTLGVVNCYSQFGFGRKGGVAPLDYEALIICLRKMNKVFKGLHIGLPQIGCHLAGGDWNIVSQIIKDELFDCDVTIVNYKPKEEEIEEILDFDLEDDEDDDVITNY